MTKVLKKFLLPLGMIIALLVMVAWLAGSFSEKIEPGLQEVPSTSISDGYTVKSTLEPMYETVPATIRAKQATSISSRLLARIEKIYVRSGDEVKQGQLLIALEQSDLASRVKQAQAAISAISARLIEAEKAYNRAKDLIKTGVIASADLDQIKASYDSLKAEQASAEQVLQEAEAGLNFSMVRAPINGRIIDRFAEPGDTAQPGVPLLSLYNPLTLRVEAYVREQLAISLMLQQELDVEIPVRDRKLNAVIEEIVPSGETLSRSFLIKASIPVTEGLLPGMYARMRIPAGEKTRLLAPNEYIAKFGQIDVVWIVKDKQLEKRVVRLGKAREKGQIEILAGLQDGELLVKPLLPKS